MKFDIEYFKELLETFERIEKVWIAIHDLEDEGYKREDKYLPFHLDLMNDKGFLIAKTDKPNYIGYKYDTSGQVAWGSVGLRLTAQGHEFLAELKEPEVWDKIKDQFRDSGIGGIKFVAKELTSNFLKQKMEGGAN